MRTAMPYFLIVCFTLTSAPALFGQDQQQSQPPATQPATQPMLVKVSDKAAIDAAIGKDVFLEGEVASAAWSQSGKVMRIEFRDTEQTKVMAVLFEKNKQKFDEAFGGDVSKTLVGKQVRLKGTLKDYRGRPEIVLNLVSDITIQE
jgi:DNA/RNA endonuclease YhcR with UshA esterase domain